MALPIARELTRFGIRVMTITPGVFATSMLAAIRMFQAGGLNGREDVAASLRRGPPFTITNVAGAANRLRQCDDIMMKNRTASKAQRAIPGCLANQTPTTPQR